VRRLRKAKRMTKVRMIRMDIRVKIMRRMSERVRSVSRVDSV
jgi:hypothetical protein